MEINNDEEEEEEEEEDGSIVVLLGAEFDARRGKNAENAAFAASLSRGGDEGVGGADSALPALLPAGGIEGGGGGGGGGLLLPPSPTTLPPNPVEKRA